MVLSDVCLIFRIVTRINGDSKVKAKEVALGLLLQYQSYGYYFGNQVADALSPHR
jgi:hypothetical protein